MKRWQGIILEKFKKRDMQSIVFIDKDNLMQDDYLIGQLQQRDYDVLNFAREVSFRNEFELRYRSKWDDGLKTKIVVIVQSQAETDYLPFDLIEKSEEVRISLMDIFPRLNYLVVKALDRKYYAKLFDAHHHLVAKDQNLRTSEKETASFLLRSVFGLDAIAIHTVEKLIGLLIEKHYSGMQIPPELQQQAIEELASGLRLTIDLGRAMEDSGYFFGWLNDEWIKYVEQFINSSYVEPAVNFAAQEINFTLDHLFSDGKLTKYQLTIQQKHDFEKLEINQHWISFGLAFPYEKNSETNEASIAIDTYAFNARLDQLVSVPDNRTLRDWLDIGYDFGQLAYQFTMMSKEQYELVSDRFKQTRTIINRTFAAFLKQSYSSISFFDDNKGPISLAKVNQYINKQRNEKEKTALVVFDGMSVSQWYLVKDYLQSKLEILTVENKCYAIAPSITSISRQALFAGGLPHQFSDTLFVTSKDSLRWSNFWRKKDVRDRRISYCHFKLGNDLAPIHEIVDSKNEILGIVINFIDDLMHAVGSSGKCGERVFFDAINSYMENSNLDSLFKELLEGGYRVYITSDHGNIAGIGTGLKVSNDTIETYAKRMVLFDKEQLAKDFAEKNNQYMLDAVSFYPEDFFPVYPQDEDMYIAKGECAISHGGLSVEEMIVPFVEIKKL